MKNLSFLATKSGKFTIAAFDHRSSLKKILNPKDPGATTREEMVMVKRELMRVFGPVVSAVLVDPMYGLGVLDEKPKSTGLLLSLEKSGYGGDELDRLTELLQEWGVDEVKEYGAAAKLLLYYHPESEQAAKQVELVKRVGDECRRKGVVFLLEPVLYQIKESDDENRLEFSLRIVKTFTGLVDILKLELPVDPKKNSDKQDWLRACEQLSQTATVPWVLLSRGMEYGIYKEALKVACRAGASGFAVGRAVWQEIGEIIKSMRGTKSIKSTERIDFGKIREFLETTGLERMKGLVRITEELGRDWREVSKISNF